MVFKRQTSKVDIRAQFFSALSQTATVLVVASITYLLHRYVFSKNFKRQSFASYMGLCFSKNQMDRKFFLIWVGVISFGLLSSAVQFQNDFFRSILTSDSSPYGKILKSGFNLAAVGSGFIYCFLQAATSEEILFRGLIGKRLFENLGVFRGNIVQATIFWLMHLVIFRLITGDWISLFQAVGFFTSFGLGLVLGYVNFRKNGQGIFPSWLLHGSVNFATFIALAFLIL